MSDPRATMTPVSGPAFHDPALDGHGAHAADRQTVLNALAIPPAREQRHMPTVRVRARVAWARDGVELVDATAEYWAGRAVLVHWRDHRLQALGVWLDVDDVERIGPLYPPPGSDDRMTPGSTKG